MRVKPGAMSFAMVFLSLVAWGQDTPAPPVPPQAAPQAAPATPTPVPMPEAAEQAPPSPRSLTSDEIKEMIRKSSDNDIQNDRKQRDYTYIERTEEHFLDHGQVKKTESETVEIMVLYGEPVERKIAKDDKPLPDKDAAKEEKKIQEIVEKRKNESDKDRQKRQQKEAKDREEQREFVSEIADAYDFRFLGVEPVDGHDAYVIDCVPRPGYQPHHKDAKYLTKFRARVWIDTLEYQLVKMDAEAIDTVSWGLFLARIHRGSKVHLEQTRINEEVWLPKHITVTIDARLALLKTIDMDIDISYRDYKKFRSETRILSGNEAAEPAAPAAKQ